MVNYFVKDGNTLGYVNSAQPNLFGVFAGKPQLGGHDWINGPVVIDAFCVLVPATLADFDRFRVDPRGHIA